VATTPGAPPDSRDGAYFDRLVEEAGDFNPFTDRGWQTLASRFKAASGNASRARILDIGCGTGRSQRIYRDHARRYVGIDLSFAALRAARSRESQTSWIQADAVHVPFRAGSFDVVAFSSVLHHLPDMHAALREAVRLAVPGGLVFAFDPNLLHPAMLLFRHPRSPLYSTEGVSPDERPLHPRMLRQAFQNAGIVGIGQRCQSNIPYRHVGPRLLNRLLPLYNAIDAVWEYSFASRAFGTFAVTWGRTP
jgi:SAM-dependent methyltransferase